MSFLLLFLLIALTIASFEQDCLDKHNEYRDQHSATHLSLDTEVQKTAQNFSNYLAANNIFEHSGGKYGENIFAVFGRTDLGGGEAVESWYSEIASYNFSDPGFNESTGHFTQVVWKGSSKLGCAYGINGSNIYIVANYDPPGNVIGYFEENVSEN